MQHIFYIDKLPVVAVDGEGVDVLIASGDDKRRERWTRSMWRKHLEVEIRRLNEWEAVERAHAAGKIVPLKR